MLYLTTSDTGHKQVYRVFIHTTTDYTIYVDDESWASRHCIIDIDEQEACILLLKGFRLFEVELLPCKGKVYLFYAKVNDIRDLKVWVKTCYT